MSSQPRFTRPLLIQRMCAASQVIVGWCRRRTKWKLYCMCVYEVLGNAFCWTHANRLYTNTKRSELSQSCIWNSCKWLHVLCLPAWLTAPGKGLEEKLKGCFNKMWSPKSTGVRREIPGKSTKLWLGMVTSENVLCLIHSQITLCCGPSVENLAFRNLSVRWPDLLSVSCSSG